jgi:hypothetical protein
VGENRRVVAGSRANVQHEIHPPNPALRVSAPPPYSAPAFVEYNCDAASAKPDEAIARPTRLVAMLIKT